MNKPGATMAAAAGAGSGGGGVVKHLVIVQFKEDVTPERLQGLISGYAGLVEKVPSMKAFHWGTDVSIENMHQGFTHVFESTFESTEGVKEYVYHPAHIEFATDFLGSTEKVLIIDFKPAAVN